MTLQISQVERLAEYMIAGARNGKYVVSVLFYYEAIDLMRELLRYQEIIPVSFEITEPECKGYDGEYYVSLVGYYDDEEEISRGLYLSVEPVVVDGRIFKAEADITMIDADARSAIIADLPNDSYIILDFDIYKDNCKEMAEEQAKDQAVCSCPYCNIEKYIDDAIKKLNEIKYESFFCNS